MFDSEELEETSEFPVLKKWRKFHYSNSQQKILCTEGDDQGRIMTSKVICVKTFDKFTINYCTRFKLLDRLIQLRT